MLTCERCGRRLGLLNRDEQWGYIATGQCKECQAQLGPGYHVFGMVDNLKANNDTLRFGVTSDEWTHFRPLCRECKKRPVMNGRGHCHACDDEMRETIDDA